MAGVRVCRRGERRPVVTRMGVLWRGIRLLRRRCRAVVVSAGAAGRPQPALRVEQEHACGHDPLAFLEARLGSLDVFQTVGDYEVPVKAGAGAPWRDPPPIRFARRQVKPTMH